MPAPVLTNQLANSVALTDKSAAGSVALGDGYAAQVTLSDFMTGAGAPPLTLQASYQAGQSNNSSVTSGSFTPVAGELLVVKAATLAFIGNVTGVSDTSGLMTWTQQVTEFWVVIWTATVPPGGVGSITVTVTGQSIGNCFTVERWSSAKLAASPATDKASSNARVASSSITTAASGSVVTWIMNDYDTTSNMSASLVRLGSATSEGVQTPNYPNNSKISDFCYQPAASAGAQSYGYSAPAYVNGNQWNWALAALEIQQA